MIRAGFFGKIPRAGDFVARGLSVSERQFWDRWITSNLAFAMEPASVWPKGGLRLSRPGQIAVILPSRDRSGRRFPLLGLILHDGDPISADQADGLIKMVLPPLETAQAGESDANALEAMLTQVATEDPLAGEATGGAIVWTAHEAVQVIDMAAPIRALKRCFDCSATL